MGVKVGGQGRRGSRSGGQDLGRVKVWGSRLGSRSWVMIGGHKVMVKVEDHVPGVKVRDHCQGSRSGGGGQGQGGGLMSGELGSDGRWSLVGGGGRLDS